MRGDRCNGSVDRSMARGPPPRVLVYEGTEGNSMHSRSSGHRWDGIGRARTGASRGEGGRRRLSSRRCTRTRKEKEKEEEEERKKKNEKTSEEEEEEEGENVFKCFFFSLPSFPPPVFFISLSLPLLEEEETPRGKDKREKGKNRREEVEEDEGEQRVESNSLAREKKSGGQTHLSIHFCQDFRPL